MSLAWDGLEELKAQLRSLAGDLAGEAAHIIEGSTNAAALSIKQGYPDRTGDLRDHVDASLERTEFGAVGTVRNTSPLAWIFENGTQARHTAIGANRGAMPPGHVFIPRAAAERRRMYEDLKDMMARHPIGLEVSGDA